MEEFFKLSQQGFKGFEEMSAMFQKFYGLENLEKIEKDAPDYAKIMQKATSDFQDSFRQYLAMLGVVPKEDYIGLVKKYEELKKRVTDQEETIRHLQMLLGEKHADQGETVKVFQDLIEKQSEQFVEMMNAAGQYFQKQEKNQS
ncbi:MAG: hypothetical protein R6U27_10815 [Desulfobacterales bacterium]